MRLSELKAVSDDVKQRFDIPKESLNRTIIAALEKQTSLEPLSVEMPDEEIEMTVRGFVCPRCKFALYTDTDLDSYSDRRGEPYCCNCGQKLNWNFSRVTKFKSEMWDMYYG